jgi:hypothetical protein
VVGALLRCEAIEQGSDALPGCFDGWLGGLSEVRAAGREASRRQSQWPGAPHGLGLRRLFMLTMSPALSRHEEMLDTGSEACSVDRSIRDARRVDPVVPQGRNLSVPRLGAMKTQSMVHNSREGVSDSGSVPRPEDTGALDGAQVLLGWRPSDDHRGNTALTRIRRTRRPVIPLQIARIDRVVRR